MSHPIPEPLKIELRNLHTAMNVLRASIEKLPISDQRNAAIDQAVGLSHRLYMLAQLEMPPPSTEDAAAEQTKEQFRLSQLERAKEFIKELERLINSKSMESGSNTPDFMIAEFLSLVLVAFDITVNAREKWYGRAPAQINGPVPT